MIPWYIGTIVGSFSLALGNSLKRTHGLSFQMVVMQITITFFVVSGYWYGFYKAPKFINCWYLGTAINSMFALMLGVMFFDKTISLQVIIAVVLLLVALYLLL